jgi:hypothetical protein
MTQNIVQKFATRRAAEIAVEHLVQQHRVERSHIVIRASGDHNTAGSQVAGADLHSGHPGVDNDGTPKLAGPVEVSVDCKGVDSEMVRALLREVTVE